MTVSSTIVDSGGIVPVTPAIIPYSIGDAFDFCLMSDLHIGAPQVDYALIERELKSAEERNARILINGDVFDAIVASDQKRYRASCVHPRLAARDDVLNAAVDWAFELLSPYADRIDMIGVGNHETAVEKHHASDLVMFLIDRLDESRKNKEHVIHHGGYCGFIRYRFGRGRGGNSDGRKLTLFYHHGAGGAAPQTKGMLDFSRLDKWVDGADIIWIGHKHNRLSDPGVRLLMDREGNIVERECRHIMTGAYMQTYRAQSQASIRNTGRRSNYAADSGLQPQSRGGALLRVVINRRSETITVTQ